MDNIRRIAQKIVMASEGITNANDMCLAIEEQVKRIFPDSMANVGFSNNLMSSITLYFTLGKDKSEYINGYWDNDPAKTIFHISGKVIEDIKDDGEITGPLSCEMLTGSIYTKPPKDSYLAMGRIKVPYRKTTGTPEKIIESIKKHFTNLKKTLQDNRENLTDDSLALIGDKF